MAMGKSPTYKKSVLSSYLEYAEGDEITRTAFLLAGYRFSGIIRVFCILKGYKNIRGILHIWANL